MGCLLRVLLKRDYDWHSRLRVPEFTKFDWSREPNVDVNLRESCAVLAATPISAGFESCDALLAYAICTVSSQSIVRCARSRCKNLRIDESANLAMKWSSASDICASVENSAYACEHRSVVRAEYAAINSDTDCRRPQSVARYTYSNSNFRRARSIHLKISDDATVSTTCNRQTFLASSDPSQAKTIKPQRSRARLHSVRNNSASAKNALIVIPDVFVKQYLDAALNIVSRSVASQAIQATAFE